MDLSNVNKVINLVALPYLKIQDLDTEKYYRVTRILIATFSSGQKRVGLLLDNEIKITVPRKMSDDIKRELHFFQTLAFSSKILLYYRNDEICVYLGECEFTHSNYFRGGDLLTYTLD